MKFNKTKLLKIKPIIIKEYSIYKNIFEYTNEILTYGSITIIAFILNIVMNILQENKNLLFPILFISTIGIITLMMALLTIFKKWLCDTEIKYIGYDKDILKKIISEIDEQAFVTVNSVHEVMGEGFSKER